LKQGFVVGEAQDEDATPSEEGVAKSIASLAAVMRRAIDLDGELGPHAEEVCEVRAYGLLATKPEATQLTAAQVLPERRVSGSRVVAVLASEDAGRRVSGRSELDLASLLSARPGQGAVHNPER